MTAKPFLKWAGGKSQLIKQIEENLPKDIANGRIKKYFEPFVGGGAVFFHLHQKYKFDETYIADVNPELILLYKVIRNKPRELIEALSIIQNTYFDGNKKFQHDFYYEIRDIFNDSIAEINYQVLDEKTINRSAQLIFLNRTCYNGLYRVNSKGKFNVPYGNYKNPGICDKTNLIEASHVLSNTIIVEGDFESFSEIIDGSSFVYFDPPYRPISQSASFTSYASNGFNEKEHVRLASYFRKLNHKGAKILLSNSDPSIVNLEKTNFNQEYFEFYQREFEEFGFNIMLVSARRNINSKSQDRGQISELLITNYR